MTRIPAKGRPWPELKAELEAAKEGDFSWRDARIPVFVFHLDDALTQVQQEAYCAYWTENNLGQRAFPSLARLEGEVRAMGLRLLNAPEGAAATFTSGGSESIYLAMRTARDWARATKGISAPNVIVPRSAHPQFSRAGHDLCIDVIRVPTTRADFRADVAGMEARIDANTIMLVGSAPNFPFGVFDPIAEIAALAQSRGLWMHVDACVGAFLAPFAAMLGHPIPSFDFTVPGVTSVSADIHKYGMAPKGASLLLLRDAALQEHQWFRFDDWERGHYQALVAQGTRPGGAVAAAWAVMNHLGEDGYLRCARMVMDTKAKLVAGVRAIEGLAVLEPSELSIFAYRPDDPGLDLEALAAAMTRCGWFISRLAEPAAIHLVINPSHHVSADRYLADLRAAVAEVRASGTRGQAQAATY